MNKIVYHKHSFQIFYNYILDNYYPLQSDDYYYQIICSQQFKDKVDYLLKGYYKNKL